MGSAQLSFRSPVCFFLALCCLPLGEQKDAAAVDKRNEDGKDRYGHARTPEGAESSSIHAARCPPMAKGGRGRTMAGEREKRGMGRYPKRRDKKETQ